jgi:hypothetical protein
LNKFSYNSDHRIIRAKLVLQILKPKRKFFPRKIQIPSNLNQMRSFQKNNIESLKEIEHEFDQKSLQDKYNVITKSLKSNADEFRIKKLQDGVLSYETKQLIALREDLRSKRTNNEEAFRSARREANLKIQRDVQQFEMRQVKEAIDNTKSLKRAREGIRKDKNWIPKLRDEHGILQSDRSIVSEIAASFYENLYASRLTNEEKAKIMPTLNNMEDVEEISTKELTEAFFFASQEWKICWCR